jgi:WD40 repeat protein
MRTEHNGDLLEGQLRKACAELARRLRAGHECRAEDFFQENPALAAAPDRALDLIKTEFDTREQLGQAPSREQFLLRFPQWTDDLKRQFQIDAQERIQDLKLDDYEPLEEIGYGPMGTVWRARQRSTNREVVLKMFAGGGPDELERFRRGAEDQACLRHDHIVPVYEVGESGAFFVMEFAEGGSLDRKIGGWPQPPAETAKCVETLARAMHYAHQQGIVHRDLKPANVVLTAAGVPKITDFGLAKRLDASLKLTQSGAVIGTLPYMAPEQVSGRNKAIGPRTDVYALGAILYEMLTGRPPFQSKAPLELLQQVQKRLPERPSKLEPGLDRRLESVSLRCLEKKPQWRYSSAEHLADDLARWLQAKRPRAHRMLTRAGREMRRHAVAGLAAATLVAVSAASVGWAVRERDIANRLGTALHQAQLREAENLLDRGLVLCERGDVGPGLLWLARALEKVPPQADRLQQVIRTQLSWWSTQVNPLKGCYDNPVPITAAALSPDGQTAWVAGTDKTIRRWDWKENNLIEPPIALETRVRALLWTPDGKTVLTVREDDTAQFWDAATGNDSGVKLGQKIRCAAWGGPAGKMLITGGPDGKVVLWSDTNAMIGRTIFAAPSSVKAVAICPDGNAILVGWDRVVGQRAQGYAQFWDAATGQALSDPLALRGRAIALTFNPDGQAALIVTDQQSQLWDVRTTKPLDRGLHKAFNEAAAFSPEGSLYLTGGHDRSARLWDTATGRSEWASFNHQASVQTVAFSAEGRTIMTAGSDGAVRIWQVAANRHGASALRHQGFVHSASFSCDNKLLLTTSWDTTARIWDLGTGESKVLHHASKPVLAGTFSTDGQMLMTMVWGSEVRLWDTVSGKQLGEPLDHSPARVSKAIMSPDSRTVLTGCAVDGTVRLWDVGTRAVRGPLLGFHKGSVMAAAFSPDGSTACTGDEGGTACLWDVAKGQARAQLKHGDAVLALVFSPNGRFLLSGSRDRRATLWDLASGGQRVAELWHGDAVRAVAFSADGKTALTGSEDGTARLWDTATGTPVGQPLAHQSHVVAVAFSPDGRDVLTGSFDWTARLWDAVTGKPLGPALRHDGRIWAVSFRPDGFMAVTAGDDNTARLWDVPAPASGKAPEIALRTEIDTGLRLDDNHTLHVLDAVSWQQRR